jgi:pimeloyl-ACP methyl ester carboxylesterase
VREITSERALDAALGAGGLLLIGGLLLLSAMIAFTYHALRNPPRRTYGVALAQGRAGDPSEIEGLTLAWEEWTFTSRGRALPVWSIAGDKADGPVIVLTHGWGDSRIGGLTRVPPLLNLASRIVLWDSPGHGEAPGRCDMGAGEIDDLLALLATMGRSRPLVLFGWSLGAGVSIAAAAREPAGVAGVIAESPYRVPVTPARGMMRVMSLPHRITLGPALRLLGLRVGAGAVFNKPEPFDRAQYAARLRCPLLVLHGSKDELSPIEDGRAIAAAAGPLGTLCELEGVGHWGLWTRDDVRARALSSVEAFVRGLEAQAARPAAASPQTSLQ